MSSQLSILIYEVSICSFSDQVFIRRGYVYVERGIVKAVGEGEPPSEFEAASLVIGGEGRLVVPAFASAHTHLTLYALRHILHSRGFNPKLVEAYVNALNDREAYLLALTALYELTLHGVTLVHAADAHGDAVARAFRDAGVKGGVAIPLPGCPFARRDWREQLELLLERHKSWLSIGVVACDKSGLELAMKLHKEFGVRVYAHGFAAEGVDGVFHSEGGSISKVYTPNDQFKPKEPCSIGLDYLNVVSPLRASCTAVSKELDLLEAAKAITLNPSSMLGVNSGVVREGYEAHLIVFDVSVPPGYIIGDVRSVASMLIGVEPRIEAVISSGQPIVDQGEQLVIDKSRVEEGSRLASKLAEEILG